MFARPLLWRPCQYMRVQLQQVRNAQGLPYMSGMLSLLGPSKMQEICNKH